MLDLMESAARLGHYQWVEMRLFEMVGSWVTQVPEPEAKLLLVVHGRRHAEHAERWHERLPVLRDLPRDSLVVPANDAAVEFIAAVAGPDGADRTIERLVALYRVVLPALVAAYELHLDVASPIADGPVIRSLRLVLSDEVDERDEGEALLERLLSDDSLRGRAEGHERRLGALLALAGGLAGTRAST